MFCMPFFNILEKKKDNGPEFLFLWDLCFLYCLFYVRGLKEAPKNITVGVCISKSTWNQYPSQFMPHDSMNKHLKVLYWKIKILRNWCL